MFDWLQRKGGVAADEMHRVFNCGIGMAIALDPGDVARATELLRRCGETVYEIGALEAASGEAEAVVV